MTFQIWPSRRKIVASKPLSLCWSMFVLSCKVDQRDDIDGATTVCPSEAVSGRMEGTPSSWRKGFVCSWSGGSEPAQVLRKKDLESDQLS